MIPTYWQTGKITANNLWFPMGYKDGNVGFEQKKSNEINEHCQNSKVVGPPSVPLVRHNLGK